jgi:uncharacterized protein YjdB
MKKLSILLLILSTLTFSVCTIDQIVLYGSISGVVKDAQTQQSLENVSVTLNPGGLTKVTGQDGSYSFDELEALEYTLTYTKPEYITITKESTVQARANNIVDITLAPEPIIPILKTNVKSLDFGKDLETLSLEITNTGKGSLDWHIEHESTWFSCSPLSGSTTKEKSTVVITVNRKQMEKGTYRQTFAIASNGGREDITVTMEVASVNLAYEPLELDFGALTSSLPLTLTNRGSKTIDYTIEASNDWIIPEKTSGKITTTDKLNVIIKREYLSPGNYNGNVTIKSGIESFVIPVKMSTTDNQMPVVSINPVRSITYSGATISGVISDIGGAKVTRHGFVLGLLFNPTINDTNFNLGDCTTPISFEQIISDLKPNTAYYVKAYAENEFGISYSSELQFTTFERPSAIPTVGTSSATDITISSAKVGGTISDVGYNTTGVTQHGHVWGKTPQPTVNLPTRTSLGTLLTPSSYSSTIEELSSNTTYYVRAYATNSVGTAYGNEVSFKTLINTPITSISLDKSKLTLETGKTSQLTATVNPDNASNKNVYWESSNTSVATVSATGLVTAKSTGTTRISVISENNPSIKAYCDVTVTPLAIPVTGVSLNKTTLSLGVDDKEQLTATISPSNATNKTVTWSSSNSSVALVLNTGYINALSEGTTTITVTTEDGNKTATCEITVSDERTGTTGLLTWKLSNGTLTISGTGAMPHYNSDNNAPWSNYNQSISNVIIESGVTNIGNSAFGQYNNNNYYNNLKSVTIPNTVTKIGNYAFYRSSLESITIPNSVTDIGACAFEYCALITVVIPDKVTAINGYTFSECKSLHTLTIGASVANIEYNAFHYCYNLTKIFVKNPTPPTLSNSTFSGTPIDVAILVVPKGSKAAYQNAGGWSDFGTIIEE